MNTEEEERGEGGDGVLIRVKAAAKILDVSVRTVWRLIASRKLTAVRIGGCTRLVYAEVLRVAEEGCLLRRV